MSQYSASTIISNQSKELISYIHTKFLSQYSASTIISNLTESTVVAVVTMSRNTLRVRLYQIERDSTEVSAHKENLSQYSASTIISNLGGGHLTVYNKGSVSRNTLRVRLYQIHYFGNNVLRDYLYWSQYSASTIISNLYCIGALHTIPDRVAILCEYDYIKSLPLEALVWQGLPARYRRHIRKSVMPKDKVLTLLTVFISILHKLNELYNIEGIFDCAIPVNVWIYNTIQFFG